MASRIIGFLAIFFLLMNLWSGMLMNQGVAGMIGTQAGIGGDEQVSQAQAGASNISTGAPTGSTLFGMYNVLATGFETLTSTITAGPTMLKQAGVPSVITDTLLQPVILIVYAYGIISLLLQFDLL